MTLTTIGLCPSPYSNTCEATICNVEHEFELPILVFLLPLFIFLFVTILLCFDGLLLLGFGVICGRTDPHSFIHLKGNAEGPLSASSGDSKASEKNISPTSRDFKQKNRQPPLSIWTGGAGSRPRCPFHTKPGPLGTRGEHREECSFYSRKAVPL